MSRSSRNTLWLALCCGCSDPGQLIVWVDTDLPKDQLGKIEATAMAANRIDEQTFTTETFPFSFGVQPKRQPAEVTIELTVLTSSGTVLLTRRAVTRVIEEKTLLLPLFLELACREKVCAGDLTCIGGECVSDQIDPATLAEIVPGEERTFDAGISVEDAAIDGGVEPDLGADVLIVDAPLLDADAALPDRIDSPDAFTPDAGCGSPWPLNPSPRAVANLGFGFDVDIPPLIADLDGDGQDEIAVGFSSAGELRVIDYLPCAMVPEIANISGIPVSSAGIVAVKVADRTLIASASGDQLWFGRYEAGEIITSTLAVTTPIVSISSLSSDPSGASLVVMGLDQNGIAVASIFQRLPSNAGTFELGSAAIGAPAYLSEAARFLLSGLNEPQIVGPALGLVPIGDGAAITPATMPAVIGPGIFGAASEAVFAYGANGGGGGNNPQLSVFRLDVNNFPGAEQRSAAAGSTPLTPPIAFRDRTSAGFFWGETGGLINGCKLIFNASWACSQTSVFPLALGAEQVVAAISPLTSYVGTDSDPDLIYTAVEAGRVVFRDDFLRNEAAPPVMLIGAPITTGAISERFFDRYGLRGSLMVVPVIGGNLTIVVWQRPPTAGPLEDLWSQFGRDAHRSAQLSP